MEELASNLSIEFIILILSAVYLISILNLPHSDEIYIAPSGVQKERIQPDDLFIQNIDGDDIQLPPDYKK